ncbi:MAG TPA: SEC-C domain-containing protein [Chloroflexota bacterium]|jgi:hypothetical protein
MAKGPGRNALCPCGSGRKYKNCCLPADEAQERAARAAAPPLSTVSVWDDLDDEDEDDALDPLDGVFPLLPPPPDDPHTQAQNALWERFEDADYETQIALFQEALGGSELDADLAFEMLTEIQATAQERGELARVDALLDQLAREAPGFYEADATYYASWRIDNALARGDLARIPAALEPFAQNPAANLDELFRVADQLLYYDQTAPLLDTLRRGWNEMIGAEGIAREQIDIYTDLILDLQVYEYVRTTAEPRANDPALDRRVAAYLQSEGRIFCVQNTGALLGTSSREWKPSDFESAPRTEPRERRLTLLAWAWVGELWRRHGVLLGRTGLAGRALVEYLIEGAAKGKSAQAMLVPARRRLERYLTDYFDVMDYREYRAGALIELLPLYLDFLVERGLIDRGVQRHALADLRPLAEHFLHQLAADRADPAIATAIRARWEATE